MRVIKNLLIYSSFLILLVYQSYKLYVVGPYQYAIHNSGTMVQEILIFSIVVLITNFAFKGKKKIYIGILLILVMAYLHSTIIPLLIVICYSAMIFFSGAGIILLSFRKAQLTLVAFVLGSIIAGLNYVCICVGILSVLNRYSVRNVWILLSVSFVMGMAMNYRKWISEKEWPSMAVEDSKYFNLFISCIEITALIQIGKAGLQGDYDALWYGIRSPYVLANSSKGIYENLNLVGFTYLYPKGFEVMLLPLSEFHSWNYQFLFNQMLAFIIVAIAWHLSKEVANKNVAYIVGAMTATLPALVSMARTVKPDVITVLFQVSALLFFVLLKKEEKTHYLSLALMCLISSYCFKITSLLFSTIIFIAALPFIDRKKLKLKDGWFCIIYGIMTLCFIWGRTFVLTGSPLIAFVGPVLTRLGIEAKYPYAIVNSINHHAGNVTILGIVKKVLNGLFGYYINPARFDHVVIAWGTSIPLLLLLYSFYVLYVKRKNVKSNFRWIWLMACITSSMMFGVAFLSQYDGNYFLLFYIASIILLGSFTLRNDRDLTVLLCISIIFNIAYMSFSDWSWSVGFTPIEIRNKGYFDQQQEYDELFKSTDGEEVYAVLNASKNNRIVAVTISPSKLVGIKGVTERWHDIAGSNPAIVESANAFSQYCRNCEIKYIYLDNQVVRPNSFQENIFIDLIEMGTIRDIIYGPSSSVLVVGNEGDAPADSHQLAIDFARRRGKIVKNIGWYDDGWTGTDIEFFYFADEAEIFLDFMVPYEIDTLMEAEIYVNDERYGKIELDGQSIQYSIEVPKGGYVKINIKNNFYKTFPGDLRHLCYILQIKE